MSEGDFWNNLDSFVEKQKQQTTTVAATITELPPAPVEKERVDDWVKNVNDATLSKTKSAGKATVKALAAVKILTPRYGTELFFKSI